MDFGLQRLLEIALPAVIASGLTYLATRRKQASDDTHSWWEETRRIREELRGEIDRLHGEINALSQDNAGLKTRVSALEDERDSAHSLLDDCERDRDNARQERDEARRQLGEAQRLIRDMREQGEFQDNVIASLTLLIEMRVTDREPLEGAASRAEQILTQYLYQTEQRRSGAGESGAADAASNESPEERTNDA